MQGASAPPGGCGAQPALCDPECCRGGVERAPIRKGEEEFLSFLFRRFAVAATREPHFRVLGS